MSVTAPSGRAGDPGDWPGSDPGRDPAGGEHRRDSGLSRWPPRCPRDAGGGFRPSVPQSLRDPAVRGGALPRPDTVGPPNRLHRLDDHGPPSARRDEGAARRALRRGGPGARGLQSGRDLPPSAATSARNPLRGGAHPTEPLDPGRSHDLVPGLRHPAPRPDLGQSSHRRTELRLHCPLACTGARPGDHGHVASDLHGGARRPDRSVGSEGPVTATLIGSAGRPDGQGVSRRILRHLAYAVVLNHPQRRYL